MKGKSRVNVLSKKDYAKRCKYIKEKNKSRLLNSGCNQTKKILTIFKPNKSTGLYGIRFKSLKMCLIFPDPFRVGTAENPSKTA